MNKEGVKTPAYYELKLKGKSLGDNKPKAAFEYMWTYSIVRRILTNLDVTENNVSKRIKQFQNRDNAERYEE